MAIDLERATIERALRASDGDIGRAARALGCARRTLQNRMRKYGMPQGQPGRRERKLPYRSARKSGGAIISAVALAGVSLLAIRHFTKA